MAVRMRSLDAAAPAWLRQWLLLGAMFQSMATAAPQNGSNSGKGSYGMVLYRGADDSTSLYCCRLWTRFRLPRHNEQEEEFRGVEFRYANESCELDLKTASGKHVFLILPEHDQACTFEDSLAQAVSANTYSLIVATNLYHKPHKNYFKAAKNGTVTAQDITVGAIAISLLEAFKPDNPRALGTPTASANSMSGGAAKLYIVDPDTNIVEGLIWLMACATVCVGALWSGSTRKRLLLTNHRLTKRKDKKPRNDHAHLDAAPLAKAASSTASLDRGATAPQPAAVLKPQGHEPPNTLSRRHPRPHKRAKDFSSSQKRPDNSSESTSGKSCPVDWKRGRLIVLAGTAYVAMLFLFPSKMRPVVIGLSLLSSVEALVVIFDSLVFLIPCASMSMKVRHYIVLSCAFTLPLIWVVFCKAHHAWILQNFLGSSISANYVRRTTFSNFKIITLISVLLVFYDIFMVFVTPFILKDMSVMMSIALSLRDVPVLMRVPLFYTESAITCSGFEFILGYGDISVPGYAVAYCRSYDVIVKRGPWYFLLAITCYGTSLSLAFYMRHIMNTGQPALLYLVPGILLPVILLAWCRGDLKNFWNGEFVPKEGLLSRRMDVCVPSTEQFLMIQSRRLLNVASPVFRWLAMRLPLLQKAYNEKQN